MFAKTRIPPHVVVSGSRDESRGTDIGFCETGFAQTWDLSYFVVSESRNANRDTAISFRQGAFAKNWNLPHFVVSESRKMSWKPKLVSMKGFFCQNLEFAIVCRLGKPNGQKRHMATGIWACGEKGIVGGVFTLMKAIEKPCMQLPKIVVFATTTSSRRSREIAPLHKRNKTQRPGKR